MTLSIVIKYFFRLIDVSRDDFFTLCSSSVTRRHNYYYISPLVPNRYVVLFLTRRVINVWSSLPTH